MSVANCPAVHTQRNCHKRKNKFQVILFQRANDLTNTLVESKDYIQKISAAQKKTTTLIEVVSSIMHQFCHL